MNIDPRLNRLQELIEQKRIQNNMPERQRVSKGREFADAFDNKYSQVNQKRELMQLPVLSRHNNSENTKISKTEKSGRVFNLARDLSSSPENINMNMGQTEGRGVPGETHLGRSLDVYA